MGPVHIHDHIASSEWSTGEELGGFVRSNESHSSGHDIDSPPGMSLSPHSCLSPFFLFFWRRGNPEGQKRRRIYHKKKKVELLTPNTTANLDPVDFLSLPYPPSVIRSSPAPDPILLTTHIPLLDHTLTPMPVGDARGLRIRHDQQQ